MFSKTIIIVQEHLAYTCSSLVHHIRGNDVTLSGIANSATATLSGSLRREGTVPSSTRKNASGIRE